MKLLILSLISLNVFAQVPSTLEEYSMKLNKDLPEKYDNITKLRKTTVENNNLIYNFLVDVNQMEYDWVLPKVKSQILSTLCSKSREKTALHQYNANLVYRYENVKGQSLGEFLVRPEHCPKK